MRNQSIERYIAKTYVVTQSGTYLVQLPDDSEYGFSLYSDDQCFAGGFGVGEWRAIPRAQVPAEEIERLDFLFE